MNINFLPKNVLMLIFLQVGNKSLINLFCTNRKFNDISNYDYFWELKFKKDYPNENVCKVNQYKNWYKYHYRSICLDILDKDIWSSLTDSISYKNFNGEKEILDMSLINEKFFKYGCYFYLELYKWQLYFIIYLADQYSSTIIKLNQNGTEYKLLSCLEDTSVILFNDKYLIIFHVSYKFISIFDSDMKSKYKYDITEFIGYDSEKYEKIIYNNNKLIVSDENIIYTKYLEIDFENKKILWVD